MKYKLFGLILGALFVFSLSFVSTATAQTATSCFSFTGWNDCTPGAPLIPYYTKDPVTGVFTPTITWGTSGGGGGALPTAGRGSGTVYLSSRIMYLGNGIYYNMDTGMNTNSPDGSCTNTGGNICSSTSDGFATLKATEEQKRVEAAIIDAGGKASDALPCTGEIHTDKTAADDCTLKAQFQLRAKGYTATCATETTGMPFVNPTSGLTYYYQSSCTVNGSPDHGAELIVGFDAAPGSTAQIQHINPGWNILGYELSGYIEDQGATRLPTSSTPKTSSTQSVVSTGSVSSWATNTLNILRNMTSIAQSIMTSQISGQVRAITVPSQVAPVSTMPVSAVSNSRILLIISQANVLPYGSLTSNEQIGLTNYLAINRTALIDQNFQTFAPASVFAWALSMGQATTLNDQAKSLGFTNLNPFTWMFVKTPSSVAIPPATLAPVSATICHTFTGWYRCGGDIPYNPFPAITPYYINGVSTL